MAQGFYLWAQKGDQYLLTNDLGRHLFLSEASFARFAGGTPTEGERRALESNGFWYEGEQEDYAQAWSGELAAMKRCSFSATQLFILVLTPACNQRCLYCQASAGQGGQAMSVETCRKAIDIALQSPASRVTIEFQGGEPTLNAAALMDGVRYAQAVFGAAGKKVDFALATNLTNCDEALLNELAVHGVHVSTSLDGPAALHDRNRPMADGKGSYARFLRGVAALRAAHERRGRAFALSAIETTTRHSLPFAREIVEAYLHLGASRIYLRPLTPLGFARARWADIGYSPEEYLQFYLHAIDHLLKLCRDGLDASEVTASIYLRRILLREAVGHTEHRSPCGGAVGQMAVDWNGKVYTCDEARMLGGMHDDAFLLGTVENSYQELIRSPVAHALLVGSCVEALPFCCDCVYSPYCAACPVVTYGMERDIVSHEVHSYRCAIARGILDDLFARIQRGDPAEMAVLYRWAEQA